MKAFQTKYGVIAVPEQLEATVKAMASIYSELAQKEIEFNVLKDNLEITVIPLTSAAKIQVEELKKQINLSKCGNYRR